MALNRGTVAVLTGLAICLAAWLLPAAKEGAVAGRLSYPQLALALLVTAATLSLGAVRAAPTRWRRPLAFRVLALGLGCLLVLVVWEGVAFLWPARHLMDNPWYLAVGEGLKTDGTDLRFSRAPHIRWTGLSRGDLALRTNDPDPHARRVTFETDSEGFRNSLELDTAEIVFLGDSFTEAGNIPESETFVARLGARLGKTTRNLATAGYSAPSELIVLKRYGLKNEPRAVVWQIAESNDLLGAERFRRWRDEGERNFKRDSRGLPSRVEAWRTRSPTYRLFELFRRPAPWPLAGTFEDVHGRTHEVRFLPRFPSWAQRPREHPGWPLIAEALREGSSLLRDRGISLTVILIPMKLRVLGDYVRFHPTEITVDGVLHQFAGDLPAGWDLRPEETLASQLSELCAELGVAFLDTTPALRQHAAAGELVYQPMDTHLSSRGHEVVTQLLMGMPLFSGR